MSDTKKTSTLRLSPFKAAYKAKECEKAVLIASTAHSAADALLNAYEEMRGRRGRQAGMTTDNEQDLLRSMLVMAAAGLDATIKQLVEDTLSHLVKKDERARNSFEKFVQRRLTGESNSGNGQINFKLLASVLVSEEPQKRLINEYVATLTDGSLQSVQSLFEISAALGAEPAAVGISEATLKPIFVTRNKIIHELDINLSNPRRTRNVRSQGVMIDATERLFGLAHAMIASVDDRLGSRK